jgi:hypothetical protein
MSSYADEAKRHYGKRITSMENQLSEISKNGKYGIVNRKSRLKNANNRKEEIESNISFHSNIVGSKKVKKLKEDLNKIKIEIDGLKK